MNYWCVPAAYPEDAITLIESTDAKLPLTDLSELMIRVSRERGLY
jgi:hypothetical protein